MVSSSDAKYLSGIELRCNALKEMVATKKPVDLSKVECYRPSAKENYHEAGNAYVTAEYPFLAEAIRDPSTTLEDLLSKNPISLKPLTLTKNSSPIKPCSSDLATTTEKVVFPTLTLEKHAAAKLSSDPPIQE
ncbi:hypothetical protein Tco_0271430 [Tanacetum coccineum]